MVSYDLVCIRLTKMLIETKVGNLLQPPKIAYIYEDSRKICQNIPIKIKLLASSPQRVLPFGTRCDIV
jgi:hypothetical protein